MVLGRGIVGTPTLKSVQGLSGVGDLD